MSFTLSLGRDRFDAYPQHIAVDTLREFAALVLSHRATSKAKAGYVCAGFGGDGRRCAANAQPRRWLALDVDGIDAEVLPDWRLHLSRWRGFGWPTASSTPDAPRERVVVELSEPVDRHQGMAIGELVIADVHAEFGAAVRVDPCTFRAEQPCFLPVGDVKAFYLLGEPLDVPRWLEQAPPPRPGPPPATADVAELADARMRWVVGRLADCRLLTRPLDNGKGYAIVCPWQRLHTSADPPGSSATALLFPAEGNGWHGGFRCLHSHCAHRGLRDLLEVLRAATRAEAAA